MFLAAGVPGFVTGLQAGLCFRKRGIEDLRKRGARCSSSATSMLLGRRLTIGAVAKPGSLHMDKDSGSSIFLKFVPLHMGHGTRGVWKMRCIALRVHASAPTHVLQFLARGWGWSGHIINA